MEISFDRVVKSYGNPPKSISEVWTERAGWKTVIINATEENVVKLAKEGAQIFNFLVVDQFGATRYPDYQLSELIVKR